MCRCSLVRFGADILFAVLCCVVLCCAVLCCVVLCCVLLCSVVFCCVLFWLRCVLVVLPSFLFLPSLPRPSSFLVSFARMLLCFLFRFASQTLTYDYVISVLCVVSTGVWCVVCVSFLLSPLLFIQLWLCYLKDVNVYMYTLKTTTDGGLYRHFKHFSHTPHTNTHTHTHTHDGRVRTYVRVRPRVLTQPVMVRRS